MRFSRAAWCSLWRCQWACRAHRAQKARGTDDATTSLVFCERTHGMEKRLHVAQGLRVQKEESAEVAAGEKTRSDWDWETYVLPSQRIFRRRQRSQALETDFLRGCQSLTDDGEKRLGPSPEGNEAGAVSKACVSPVVSWTY